MPALPQLSRQLVRIVNHPILDHHHRPVFRKHQSPLTITSRPSRPKKPPHPHRKRSFTTPHK